MIEAINGKKILFFGIGFYDYEKVLKENLEKEGAVVDYVNTWERLPFSRLVTHINKNYQLKRIQNNLEKMISKKNDYDFIFVIKGDAFTNKILIKLKSVQKKAKFILYEWDSIRRFQNLLSIIPFFDSVYSFDFEDCEKYGFKYRPLFSRTVSNGSEKKDIDLFFLGWAHSNRIKILNDLFQRYNNSEKKIVLKILVSKIQYLKLIFNKTISKAFKKKCLLFKPFNYSKYICLLSRTKAVLDLCHPEQTGLTMRTIEAVSMGCYLYTTNKNIVKENNIDSKMYSIIESVEDIDLNIHYKFVPPKNSNYEIKQFLEDLFTLER